MKNIILLLSFFIGLNISAQTFEEKLSNAGIEISKDYVIYDDVCQECQGEATDIPDWLNIMFEQIFMDVKDIGA